MKTNGKRGTMTNLFWTSGVTGRKQGEPVSNLETGPQKYRWTTDRKRRTLVIKH